MQETYSESIRKVMLHKHELEENLDIKITNKGKLIFVEGNAEDEYLALKIIEAIDLGFPIAVALTLRDEEIILQVLNIRDVTKRNDLERIRARIIGTHGKTLKNMKFLTDCEVVLHDNKIGIIGHADDIAEAITSLKSLVQGSKQGHVYARLERKKKEKRLNPRTIRKQDLKIP